VEACWRWAGADGGGGARGACVRGQRLWNRKKLDLGLVPRTNFCRLPRAIGKLRYTGFIGLNQTANGAEDLPQSPRMAWRDNRSTLKKRLYRKQSVASSVRRTPEKQPARGDARRYLVIAFRIYEKAPSGAFFIPATPIE
jgi:hypothetical protein